MKSSMAANSQLRSSSRFRNRFFWSLTHYYLWHIKVKKKTENKTICPGVWIVYWQILICTKQTVKITLKRPFVEHSNCISSFNLGKKKRTDIRKIFCLWFPRTNVSFLLSGMSAMWLTVSCGETKSIYEEMQMWRITLVSTA